MFLKYLISGLVAAAVVGAQDFSQEDEDLIDSLLNDDHRNGTDRPSGPSGRMMAGPGAAEDPEAKRMTKMILQGIKQKAKREGLPKHVRASLKQYKRQQRGQNRGVMDELCENENCQVPIGLQGIWNYGCWCNFGEHVLSGAGPTVNKLDEVCKDFQLCMRCGRQDAKAQGEVCDIGAAEYDASMKFAGQGLFTECEQANNNYCDTYRCTCDIELLGSILELMWQSYVYEPEFLHGAPYYWDNKDQCHGGGSGSGPGGNGAEIACCGLYPHRKPFHVGNMQCCKETNLYNELQSECCDDAVPRSIGMCPSP